MDETILAIERAFRHQLQPSERKTVVDELEKFAKRIRMDTLHTLSEPNRVPDDE